MTLFGKILVILNLVLSLFLATWALGVYTQRIDWHSKGGGPDKIQGEIPKQRDRIDQLWRTLQTAEARWKTANAVAWVPQKQRGPLAKWYAAQLATLETGNNPVKTIVYKDGRLQPPLDRPSLQAKLEKLVKAQPEGSPIPQEKLEDLIRPELVDAKDRSGQPLHTLEYYRHELELTDNSIAAETKRFTKATEEDADLTLKLGGNLASGGKIKGLRQRLQEEKVKQERVEAEQKFLSPLLVNSEVEAELLNNRHEQLLERVKELQSLGVAERR
jgi:hypothetical protein